MSEDKCTAFVMVHQGKRLGWKICRDEIKDCLPSSRYFGVGPERHPNHSAGPDSQRPRGPLGRARPGAGR